MAIVVGYDVGGAHLKVARLDNGRPVAVRQIVCALWQGIDKLDRALAEAADIADGAEAYAVTMTGELSDLFDSRRQGVERLVGRLVTAHGPAARFWMGQRGFGTPAEAVRHHADVASTNFLATAAAVAAAGCPDALLIDMGSTTTDIIAVTDGQPCPHGLNDADRLISGELVYTGLTRTALMAIANEAPFRGVCQRLVREYYATAADARRVLGILPDDVDLHATADGRGRSDAESLARLARMLGREPDEGSAQDWRTVAAAILERQLASIADGARQVLAATPARSTRRVVTAGIGADTAASVAARLGGEAGDGVGFAGAFGFPGYKDEFGFKLADSFLDGQGFRCLGAGTEEEELWATPQGGFLRGIEG